MIHTGRPLVRAALLAASACAFVSCGPTDRTWMYAPNFRLAGSEPKGVEFGADFAYGPYISQSSESRILCAPLAGVGISQGFLQAGLGYTVQNRFLVASFAGITIRIDAFLALRDHGGEMTEGSWYPGIEFELNYVFGMVKFGVLDPGDSEILFVGGGTKLILS